MYNDLLYHAPFSPSATREREKIAKYVRDCRGNSKPERIDLAILPNFYYSHNEWMFGFTKHYYLYTHLMVEHSDTYKKIEGMLTLYYSQKYLAVLNADINNEQSIKNATQIYDKDLSRWELNITVHKEPSKPSREINLFKNQMINSLSLLIENLDKYSPIMSEYNQKLAERYKNELSKYQQLIKSGKFDLTKFHKLAHKFQYENEEAKDSVTAK